jgi:hypothetical protein
MIKKKLLKEWELKLDKKKKNQMKLNIKGQNWKKKSIKL